MTRCFRALVCSVAHDRDDLPLARVLVELEDGDEIELRSAVAQKSDVQDRRNRSVDAFGPHRFDQLLFIPVAITATAARVVVEFGQPPEADAAEAPRMTALQFPRPATAYPKPWSPSTGGFDSVAAAQVAADRFSYCRARDCCG